MRSWILFICLLLALTIPYLEAQPRFDKGDEVDVDWGCNSSLLLIGKKICGNTKLFISEVHDTDKGTFYSLVAHDPAVKCSMLTNIPEPCLFSK